MTTQQKQSVMRINLEVGATQVELCFSPLLFQFEHQTGLLEDENSISLDMKFQQVSFLRLLMMTTMISNVRMACSMPTMISNVRMACSMPTLMPWKVP